MAIGIIIIGDEILSGRRQDKHMAAVIERLKVRGMRLAWAEYCGDEPQRLIELFKRTFATQDIVLSFGGIGSTPDDHTRQCAAKALGLPLELHPEAAAKIRQRIRERFGEEASAERLQMGEFPQGAEIIPNPVNGIPGFSIRQHFFVPGFPEMAWPMVEWVLDSRCSHLQHLEAYREDSLIVFDIYESRLVDLMKAIEAQFGVIVFSLPCLEKPGVRAHIELGAKGEPKAVAQSMEYMQNELTGRGVEWQSTAQKQ